MIIPSRANVWAILIVCRADGIVTVSPVNAPLHIHEEILQLLRKGQTKVVPAVPAES